MSYADLYTNLSNNLLTMHLLATTQDSLTYTVDAHTQELMEFEDMNASMKTNMDEANDYPLYNRAKAALISRYPTATVTTGTIQDKLVITAHLTNN